MAYFGVQKKGVLFRGQKDLDLSTRDHFTTFTGGLVMSFFRNKHWAMAVFFMLFVLLTGSVVSADDSYPRRPPNIVIGYAAGGGTDTAIRPIALEMEKYLGSTITVLNMPGADSAVAVDYVRNQPKDGYWLLGTGADSISVTLRIKNLVDTNWREWEAMYTMFGPDGLVVRKDSPIKNLDDAIEFLRQGNVVCGVTGLGSSPHLFFEELNKAVGGKPVTYVPHGGCHPAGVATIAGEVPIALVTLSAVWDFVRAGELRVLAAFGVEEPVKVEVKEETVVIPNIGSKVPGTEELDKWKKSWPIFVHRDVPAPIRAKLREAFVWACQQPSVHEFAEANGLVVAGIVGEDADRMMCFSESFAGWMMEKAGQAEISPAELGIPTVEEWVWPPDNWDYQY